MEKFEDGRNGTTQDLFSSSIALGKIIKEFIRVLKIIIIKKAN